MVVFCPHFRRSVTASRNVTIDRLVACDDSDRCRDPQPAVADGTDHTRPFPHGCPVFPSLAK